MNATAESIKDLFSLQNMDAEQIEAVTSGEAFEKMKQDLGKDSKSFVLQKMLPELLKRLDEMLDLDITTMLTNAWAKNEELAAFAADQEGDEPETVPLVTHTITSHHEPHLDLEIKGLGKTLTGITLQIDLTLTLDGATLTFQKGKLIEIAPGSCKVGGRMSYNDLTLLEKESGPLQLPQKWTFEEGLTLPVLNEPAEEENLAPVEGE
ncbi:MAG: hypothetical protein QNK37_09205 [Acidobacteriota bacterium]|nr:hypothetical protein [Acidobacteriota bacterium]